MFISSFFSAHKNSVIVVCATFVVAVLAIVTMLSVRQQADVLSSQYPLHNSAFQLALDVNNDKAVTHQDYEAVKVCINGSTACAPFPDVDKSGSVTPLDVLFFINQYPLHNFALPLDVDNKEAVTQEDYEAVKKYLNGQTANVPFPDVNMDKFVTPSDVLFFINQYPLHNFTLQFDANNDGVMTKKDSEAVTSYINDKMAVVLFPDVDMDKSVTSSDVLKIVNGIGAQCGNGVVQIELEEQCDDGNIVVGDGCNGACKAEIMRSVVYKPTQTNLSVANATNHIASGGRNLGYGGDGKNFTIWLHTPARTADQWWGIALSGPKWVMSGEIDWFGVPFATDVIVEGSNDNNAWNKIYSFTANNNKKGIQSWSLPTAVQYQFYRYKFHQTRTKQLPYVTQIIEARFFEAVAQ